MLSPNDVRGQLLAYAMQVTERLSGNGDANARKTLHEVVRDIGHLCRAEFVGLLRVGRAEPELSSGFAHLVAYHFTPDLSDPLVLAESAVTAVESADGDQGDTIAERTGDGVPAAFHQLSSFSLFFFGDEAVETLRYGECFHTEFDADERACSKFVSGFLRDLNVDCCELIPIHRCDQLHAVVMVAYQHREPRFDDCELTLIRLIVARVLLTSQYAARQRRMRKWYRQWKRVADGACDFAVRVSERYEITRVIPFRQTSPPAVVGLLITEFVSENSRESVVEAILQAGQKTGPRTTQFFAVNTAGRPCSYTARVESVSATNGRSGWMIYLTNNDVERAHEEELLRIRERLDRATRLSLLGNIATEFAHQLMQPLQAITTNLDLLRRRVSRKEPQRRFVSGLERIGESVKHSEDIIRSLRDFVTNRRMEPRCVPLATMVEHAVRMVATQMDRAGVRVTIADTPRCSLQSGDQPVVFADIVQTTHVIINLLINALEALKEAGVQKPEIVIDADLTESCEFVILRVTDNGPGISLPNPDRVFERFYTTKSEGFGIGLAICREVVEQQGGHIRVYNNATRGCCFSFTLPLSREPGEDETGEMPDVG